MFVQFYTARLLLSIAFLLFSSEGAVKRDAGITCDPKTHVCKIGRGKDDKVVANSGMVQLKKDLNEEIKKKYGDFKENCFPKPSGGCKCNEKDANGVDAVANYDSDADCKVLLDVQEHKKKVNEEIRTRYGNFRENCFPKPSGGCKCNEKNAANEQYVVNYDDETQCRYLIRTKRRTSQNVRDPVREKAQANYRAVINELNEKFKGLKEGCFPRPKGCLCVIGKDRDGRDITERRMKDDDCKCKPGERGNGCPAPAA